MALYYYMTTTSLGIILSVILVQTIKPGDLLKNENIVSQNTTRSFITLDTILDLFRYLLQCYLYFMFYAFIYSIYFFIRITEILYQKI